MSEQLNEQELVQYIADKTKADVKHIQLVLKHEQAYLNNAKSDDVDIDDIIDYILRRPDVKLNELTVDSILEAEMDYLIKKGFVTYED
ncbi:hypothetical protein ACFQ88_27155 [Paenibacillus sp. NPDC056579]|uniref:hypothetical protein n=1 Tax=unclassified Paenibacillus TaxID=185978 RepID=UPI001EF7F9CD|nr:hypothetical protein [Paenibacillus sp. H1-7]ULL13071.1 hypothetical protein DVH26_00410 [Paenibacillus sp. H1-7]